ncbi:MAG: hypothetical protein ACO21T_09190 [Alphaproteobacteria bacterium]
MEESSDDAYRLVLLFDRSPVVAHGVVRRDSGVHIRTADDILPVYSFKMEPELMRLLKDNMEVWYE